MPKDLWNNFSGKIRNAYGKKEEALGGSIVNGGSVLVGPVVDLVLCYLEHRIKVGYADDCASGHIE